MWQCFFRRGKYMGQLKVFAFNDDVNQGLLIIFIVFYYVDSRTDETKIREFALPSKYKMVF
jgi:hypothetical protein